MPSPSSPTRQIPVIAQDPGVCRDGKPLVALVAVPAEALDPGPRGHRVQVVDYDGSTNMLYRPHPDGLAYPGRLPSGFLNDPHFHAQNAYGIVMRVLSRFESALGRRAGWGFEGPQIQVAPHAFADVNAFYSRRDNALLFGYFPRVEGRGMVYTCLAHDVVAHETAHALLDGLRRQYLEPSSPDQAAFHEGFADIVALLSVLSLPEIVGAAMRGLEGSRAGLVLRESVGFDALRQSALLELAREMGQELSGIRGEPLRRSAAMEPGTSWKQRPEFLQPHRRGEILVAAILRAMLRVWAARLEPLGAVRGRWLDAGRVAEEGAQAADHLLTMAVRALDYAPPTDLTFGDYASALLTADLEVQPDDARYRYRDQLRESFAEFGVEPAGAGGAEAGAWKPAGGRLRYDRNHFEPLQRDPDEMFRFLWENRGAGALRLCPDAFTRVLSVRPCLRRARDGFLLRETVAEYTQSIRVRAAELRRFGVRKPDAMPGEMEVELNGGGALIFDEYNQLKYHVQNRILDASRQTARLEHLWESGHFAKGGRRRTIAGIHRERMGWPAPGGANW